MVQLKTYKCDRCREKFELELDSEPEGVLIDSFGEEKNYDLCGNCIATVSIMMTKVKEFDELAEKLYKEESV